MLYATSLTRRCLTALLTVSLGSLLLSAPGHAKEPSPTPVYTPTITGALGLNTVPSARMDYPGTIRAFSGLQEPYFHSGLGFQIAEPLYIGLRQSAQSDNPLKDPDRFFPGVDLKLRLTEENAYWPQTVIGIQSATGHKRTAGEYIALSKRFHNFDFTAGMGWGRMGSAAHISNPFKIFGSHFGRERALDGEDTNMIEDWFTGEHIGFFGGIEYFPGFLPAPLDKRLSIKADWGADRMKAEKALGIISHSTPWSIGLAARPAPWLNMGINGNSDHIGGHISLRAPLGKWPGSYTKKKEPPPLNTDKPPHTYAEEALGKAERLDIDLYHIRRDGPELSAVLEVRDQSPTPLQIGRAARVLASYAGEDIEVIAIRPVHHNLGGPAVKILRSDLEKAVLYNAASPQEIWQNAQIKQSKKRIPKRHYQRPDYYTLFDDVRGYFKKHIGLNLTLQNDISLKDESSGLLYRTSLLLDIKRRVRQGVISGSRWRLNIADNLHRLNDGRYVDILPVRSDIDRFAKDTVGLDRLYGGYTTTIAPSLYGGFGIGYLEEMYGGLGLQLLYRPFGKRFGAGIDLWQAFKRDPATALHTGFNGDGLLTGHLDLWYDIPRTPLTAQLSLGRYLGEDIGGSASLTRRFKNGAEFKAFATITDEADIDVFGSTTHMYSGLALKLPIGNLPLLPSQSSVNTVIAPLGRDEGQRLDPPFSLYEMTQPFSYAHITDYWTLIDK